MKRLRGKLYDQGGEKRVRDQHRDECAGEQPGQLFDAIGRADVVADRTNDVVTGKNQKVIDEAQTERADFWRFHIDGLP